ncbi:uncharacterized protein LOC133745001 [Rosa rugosa]|uniref:uncharacterized protein LOC133745001 n=1 Tax=Rosa rugosa TaxID=74645 RepID=UPI002B41609F|nr:uncharacterized protein LOC133745001 [Rosa rugosa]
MGVPECEEMGFEGNISDAGPEGDDSDGFTSAHESDSEGNNVGHFRVKGKRRFNDWVEFNEKADMKTPRFCLGMVFPNSTMFKHAVLTKKELRFPRNTKHQVLVRCKTSPDCPFWMYASSPDMHNPTLQIRTYRPNHTCSSIGKKVYHCHAPFLSEEYKDVFLADGKWTREGIQSAVIRDLGMEIGHQLAYKAKARAARLAQGTLESQYNLLESYAHELKKETLTAVFGFKQNLKEMWQDSRECFHKGQLLSAVGIDGNNGMYPIAWAIVEQECRDSWTWFLTFLKEDLQIHH